MIADINLENDKQTLEKIESLGRKALHLRVDVSNESEVMKMLNTVLKQLGNIDFLIKNVGISLGKFNGERTLVENMPEQEFDRVIAVDLKGVFNCAKYVVQHMIKRGSGGIISISSSSAKLTDLRVPSGVH